MSLRTLTRSLSPHHVGYITIRRSVDETTVRLFTQECVLETTLKIGVRGIHGEPVECLVYIEPVLFPFLARSNVSIRIREFVSLLAVLFCFSYWVFHTLAPRGKMGFLVQKFSDD